MFQRWVERKPTVFFGAPTGDACMLASPRLPAASEVALRLCSSAGNALPKDIGERFTAHYGCAVIDGIGSTGMLHIDLSNRASAVRWHHRQALGYDTELRADDMLEVSCTHVSPFEVAASAALPGCLGV